MIFVPIIIKHASEHTKGDTIVGLEEYEGEDEIGQVYLDKVSKLDLSLERML